MSAVAADDAERGRALVVVAKGWRRGAYPRHTELAETTEKLRALLGTLLSDAEGHAAKLIEGSPARQTLAEVIAEAQRAVAAGPGPGLQSATDHARALADAADRLLRDRGENPR